MKINLKDNSKISINEIDDEILKGIVEKKFLPKKPFEKVVCFNENKDCETFHFKIGNIKTKQSKWYNPFSWFKRSAILENCELIILQKDGGRAVDN